MDEKQKKQEEKEQPKRCPFDKDLVCEDCRLYRQWMLDVEECCVFVFLAMRAV